jgi:hypothetical protein
MKKNILLSIVLLLAFLGTLKLRSPHPSEMPASLTLVPTVVPPENIKYFTFGYRDPIADSLWIRVLQNIDFCENPTLERNANLGKTLDEILTNKLKPPRCNKGWVYQMIDRVTDLAPKFRMAHAVGATILSVGVDDREGARLIFDKATERFSDDWSILFRAGYHYLYEIQDEAKAAELMQRAHKNGAPEWTVSLAARLYTKAGKAEIATVILTDFLEKNPEGPAADRARTRLKEIQTALKQDSNKN